MTLSAALDSGLAFGVVVIFFCFLYPGWGWLKSLEWWGTRVYKEVSTHTMVSDVMLMPEIQGCDWQACPYKTLGPGERFGSVT